MGTDDTLVSCTVTKVRCTIPCNANSPFFNTLMTSAFATYRPRKEKEIVRLPKR